MRRGGDLLMLAHLFGKAFVIGHFCDKRGHRPPKEVGDFRVCNVLRSHSTASCNNAAMTTSGRPSVDSATRVATSI